ncbi:MAG TPA: 50S ribosomal protein L15 [Planctomycetaceae bacterium]|nr:50S ribosomal protein L15 [Planctomycetaceae bacterium]HCK55283.1 50S ribosomal protein L15 [Planctomycetaceae bacterium]
MILDDVHRGISKRKRRRRVGRGPGSGHGKTAGRGHKGYGSRAGASRRPGFQGGQMPLFRRMAKRGFNNKAFADVVAIVNVATLEELFEKGDTVDQQTLQAKGLAKGRFDLLKILGQGDLSKSLTVVADRFSKSAVEKIEAAGGTVQVVGAE